MADVLRSTSRGRPLIAVATLLALLGACGTPETSRSESQPATEGVYLSIGDSYAAGYRPADDGEAARNTTDGFAWQVASAAGLTLHSQACSGITAVAFVDGPPCPPDRAAPGSSQRTDGSELDALTEALAEHGDEVELVTVVLGGNDVLRCLFRPDWRPCVEQVMPRVESALDDVLGAVTDAVAADTTVVGLTYPNVLLGGGAVRDRDPDLDDEAVELFRDVINPALEKTYRRHGARFIDVTEAFDGYVPAEQTVTTEEHGEIPVRTATICSLTFYCDRTDIHPRPEGHAAIAELVLSAFRDE